jgi:cation:H+ antiporter
MLAIYCASLRLITRSGGERGWKPLGTETRRVAETSDAGPETGRRSLRQLVLGTIVVGIAICGAGYLLTTAGEAVARQTGIGSSFFAIVFLAFATSLPEWSTVVASVRLRRYEMALSDVLGTNLVNVVIVVLVDAMHGGGPVLREVGATASIGALVSLVLTAIFLVGLLERRDRTLLRMGYDSLAVVLVYLGGLILLYLRR